MSTAVRWREGGGTGLLLRDAGAALARDDVDVEGASGFLAGAGVEWGARRDAGGAGAGSTVAAVTLFGMAGRRGTAGCEGCWNE